MVKKAAAINKGYIKIVKFHNGECTFSSIFMISIILLILYYY